MGTPVVKADHLGRPIVKGPSGSTYPLAYDHGSADLVAAVDYHLKQIVGGHPELRQDIDTLLDARNELTVEAHP